MRKEGSDLFSEKGYRRGHKRGDIAPTLANAKPKMQIATYFRRSIFRKEIGVGADEVAEEGILRCRHVAKVTPSSMLE